VIRTGIVLPTFRETADDALEAAHQAFEAGVDGVFCYDHIWPLGEPDRPALAPFPILAALAASAAPAASAASAAPDASGEIPTTPGGGPYFGTLVARVGLAPNAVLLGQFRALDLLAPGRIIAGLGTGDGLSEAENRAYGIPFPPAAERRADMVELGRSLRALGITVWVAGGPAARVTEARAVGAALNLWDADPALVASTAHGPEAVEVTWGGPPPKRGATLESKTLELAQAGATWAIFGWPVDPVALAAAARGSGA
jgi:alkanesulfonate monooxygenase SsuD/methylene tetrahydromethanopterin reductase-like flavin-dependent oxidoreductase (luciferase family)